MKGYSSWTDKYDNRRKNAQLVSVNTNTNLPCYKHCNNRAYIHDSLMLTDCCNGQSMSPFYQCENNQFRKVHFLTRNCQY